MKRIYLFLILSFCSTLAFSQYINSNKDVIYQLDKADNTQIKFNSNEVSIESNYLRFLTIFNDTSAVKANVVGIKIGLVNTDKILDVDRFNINDYGFNAQISMKWTLKDTIFSPRPVWTGSIGLKYQLDN